MKHKIEELKVGDEVFTKKGCRMVGPTGGVIIGWSKWKDYDAAMVKKYDGRISQFLVKNLYKTKSK